MYTDSSLATVKIMSPNVYGPRKHTLDTITIHCTAGQTTAKALGNMFAKRSRRASSNYGIGYDGTIGLYVHESDASQCSNSKSNDNRAITIEVSSTNSHPYPVTKKAYLALIVLVTDICRRNPSIGKLKWKGDKRLIGQVNKQNMTVHRWFAAKACPGDYLYERMGAIAAAVNANLESKKAPEIQNGDTDFQVKVNVPNLNIRCGPGTNYAKTRTYMPSGVYTIVETSKGTGSKSGWGKLKSGAGWISLDYVTKL